jgi:Mrp family chromosome partitioning ATPase
MSKNFELLQQAGKADELFRTTIASTSTANQAVPGLPIDDHLDAIRRAGEGRRPYGHHSVLDEEIRLVQQVFLSTRSPRRPTVLFAGVERHADGAAICARAATILAAQSERKVCLVDADLRQPALHRLCSVEGALGLANLLREGVPLSLVTQEVSPRLWLMPAGSAGGGPHTFGAPERLRSALSELRERFDTVLVSAPPFQGSAESLLLSQLSDGVVLVVEAHATRRKRARKVKESLDSAQVPVLGVVLNNRTFPIPEALYRRL